MFRKNWKTNEILSLWIQKKSPVQLYFIENYLLKSAVQRRFSDLKVSVLSSDQRFSGNVQRWTSVDTALIMADDF